MAFYTKQQARNAAAKSVRQSYQAYNAKERINEKLKMESIMDSFDVFLSHSINDAELVLGVKELLEEQGLTVYVDWDTDKQLSREKVDKKTAAILRQRMNQSNTLIYIATDNSSESKWMPWELGYFDGTKPEKIGILPLLDSENQTFQGQEYLSLYPVIEKNNFGGQVIVKTDNPQSIKSFCKKPMYW